MNHVVLLYYSFFFNDTAPTEIYTYAHTLSLHDALPIFLQLSDYVLRVAPDRADVRDARIKALRALGAADSNPNARHWYQVSAGELAGDYELPARIVKPTPAMLARMPLARVFDGMAVHPAPPATRAELGRAAWGERVC